MKRSLWLGLGLVALNAGSIHAALQSHAPRGTQLVEVAVPGRPNEICVVPKHFTDGDYSEKDVKKEKELCAINIYANAAVCPKLNSTNPGLDIFAIPDGSTLQKFEASGCKVPKGDKIAKYKLSTSCSYTPSILAYYHVSRILGNVAKVPPAVLRTVDIHKHLELGAQALSRTNAGDIIHQTWSGLVSALQAGINSKKRDLLFTDDFQQSYGALLENPSHESFYKAFFNGGADNVGRAVNFRDRNPTMQLLARSQDISTLIGRDFKAENVQKMVQLKDASEMIILDTLLNQQDRFGNIHAVDVYMYRDAQSGKLKADRKLKPEEIASLGAVQVKQMILKDNDCGVAKDNVAVKAGLASRIMHLDPDTYSRLMKLDAQADQGDAKAFFTQGLVFTAADYASFRKNLKTLATTLNQECKSGRLKLDLDLDSHFSRAPLKTVSCD
ncbi:MAG: hypothetical protein ACXWQE_10850 [Bdellovibrionales bacterium]